MAQVEHLPPLPGNPRILLVSPDIRYYQLTAGGNPELHDDWTLDAVDRFRNSAIHYAETRGVDLVVQDEREISEATIRYSALHAAVGESVITHALEDNPLPSRHGNGISDWTLGPGVAAVAENVDADYALFVHVRDSKASGGRVAFAILAAAAKVSIPTGSQHGFASLVDLQTGQIAWFTELHELGDELHTVDDANLAVNRFLDRAPLSRSFASTREEE